jgi:hypothetical protein
VGTDNTADGFDALFANTTGGNNTADGLNALANNTTGSSNTAVGFQALLSNATGNFNTASGVDALSGNTTGFNNTAAELDSLFANTTGNFNIAIGHNAGFNLTTGNDDIDIGNNGVAGESNTIRVGTPGTQTATFIAGVGTASLTSGTTVIVNSKGRLGILKSSARYKRDIHDMGDASDKLMKLRPVSFRYIADPTGTQQYG